MGKLGKYIRPYAGYIILTMLIKLVGTGLELFIPSLMEVILDKAVPMGDMRRLLGCGAMMVLCAFGCVGGNILANCMAAHSSGKMTLAIRHDLFDKLQRLSSRQMDELTVSSAESRLTSDTYNVNQLLTRIQRLGVRAPILLIGGIAMMLAMDAGLALVLIALLPLIGVIVYVVTKKSVPLYTQEQSVLDRVVRVLQENITGIRVIKALSKTEYEKQRFNAVNEELTAVDRHAGSVSAVTNPATTLVLNLGLTLVVAIGAIRVNGGACQSGVIVAFLQYFVMILNAMLGITRIFIMWSKGQASALRVAEILAIERDLTLKDLPKDEEQAAHHIVFDHVSFSYTGIGTNIHNLSFALDHGQSLGIIGATGSGKSTVLNLLMRFYDVDSGRVLLDGRDVRSIPRQELMDRFGAVFQNDFAAEGTIAENIRFFRDIPDDAVHAAAADAQALPFIEQKQDGMNSAVAVRGNNLSGGQKQRLLISRALAGKPEILILDDASSALDYRTDADLRAALRKNHSEVTTVTVAQRVSSIRHCDLILVLDDGEVIGQGTHAQLLETCSEYRLIAETQMGDGEGGQL